MQKKSRSTPAAASRGVARFRPRRKVEWHLLTGDDLKRPGATLINLILAAATDRRIGMAEIGKEALGVSPSYFHALRSGSRPLTKLGDEHIEHAAAFLGMPKVAVLVAAGRLDLEDFYAEPATYHKYLAPALRHIQSDPEIGHFVPAAILEADPAIQKCFVLLYEKATGATLIPGKVSASQIAERHRSLLESSAV